MNTEPHKPSRFDFESYLDDKIRMVNAALEARLPPETARPALLHQAMRHSVFAGGKRLRPILCMAAAEAVGARADCALVPGIAVEILHTYTLIHDDLPAMDNDTLRRGKPTAHVVFGEANAILAGDALLTLAFEWLAGIAAPPPQPPGLLSLELARAAGSQGVIGGQVEDMAAEGRAPDAGLVNFIHLHKTADLIVAAVRMGAITGGADAAALEAVTQLGRDIGLAFQIADDILNATSSAEALGKAAGSDKERRKLTYVAVFGLDAARAKAKALSEEAARLAASLPGFTEPLVSLARYAASRGK